MLAIFDKGGLEKSTLENDPRIYHSIAHGRFFHDGKFSAWMIRAAWNTLLIYALVHLSIAVNDTGGGTGSNHGLFFTSTVVYTAIVLLCSARILLECRTLSAPVVAWVVISIAGYFPVVKICSEMKLVNPSLYRTFEPLFRSGNAATVLGVEAELGRAT